MASFNPTVSGGYTPILERPISSAFIGRGVYVYPNITTVLNVESSAGFLSHLVNGSVSNNIVTITLDGVKILDNHLCLSDQILVGEGGAFNRLVFSDSLKIQFKVTSGSTQVEYTGVTL